MLAFPGLNLGDSLTSGMPLVWIRQPATRALTSDIAFGGGRVVNGRIASVCWLSFERAPTAISVG